MSLTASVILPVYNGASTLADCLRSLAAQSFPHAETEILVVDDGSTDDSAQIASRFAVRLLQQPNRGPASARNTGIAAARGTWLAFTDADCYPTRRWLASLLSAAETGSEPHLGAAGKTLGYRSDTPAARFVDLMGGLDAERLLQHRTFPFATTTNVMIRADVLRRSGGFDERFRTSDACDLFQRLGPPEPASFPYVPHAVVLHQHRKTWREYWIQQWIYGRGLGHLYWHHRDRVGWSLAREAGAWWKVAGLGVHALRRASGDEGLARRGLFVRHLAQRIGFVATHWNPRERKKWTERASNLAWT